VERSSWTDARLEEKMHAVDDTFARMDRNFDRIFAELQGIRSDFARAQEQLVRIGFAGLFVLLSGMIALFVALAA